MKGSDKNLICLKWMDTAGDIVTIFHKGDNFDFWFAVFLHVSLKSGLLFNPCPAE